MPSWNIHIAQTECLLDRCGATSRVVRDRNAFLFGNLVPDIFVGYMVPDVDHKLPYRETHFTEPVPIPEPDERAFWDGYVAPLVDARRVAAVAGAAVPPASSAAASSASVAACARRGGGGDALDVERVRREAGGVVPGAERVRRRGGDVALDAGDTTPSPAAPPAEASALARFDMVLGAWAHLVADKLWNGRVHEYLDAIGGKPGEEFRIKKQGDFDWFGKTLHIEAVPEATPELYAAAAAFPQYEIDADAVDKTIRAAAAIVAANPGSPHHPPYRLLTDEFFDRVFTEVIETTDALIQERFSAADERMDDGR